jgi:hypothetical protein
MDEMFLGRVGDGANEAFRIVASPEMLGYVAVIIFVTTMAWVAVSLIIHTLQGTLDFLIRKVQK